MGDTELEVDLEELRSAAARIDRLVAATSSCHRAREDEFGAPVLEDAARAFRTRWGHGLGELLDDLTQAATRLRQAADAFELADEEVAELICLAPQ